MSSNQPSVPLDQSPPVPLDQSPSPQRSSFVSLEEENPSIKKEDSLVEFVPPAKSTPGYSISFIQFTKF